MLTIILLSLDPNFMISRKNLVTFLDDTLRSSIFVVRYAKVVILSLL
jgi:hypothetical protein